MPLADGQALKLTTSRYFTPSGASIHDRGIEPDVTLVKPAGAAAAAGPADVTGDPTVRAALQYLRDRSLGTQVALAGQR
jgi:carboxyl-terminal processing protease